MSKIGNKPIILPAGVEVSSEGGEVEVKGPKGTLKRKLPEGLAIQVRDGSCLVKRQSDSRQARSLHGLFRTLLANMIEGTSKGFIKELELRGVGFKAEFDGSQLKLLVGFSHPVFVPVPADLNLTVEGLVIRIFGIDKEKVTSLAAVLRAVKPPDVYKGKGLRYLNEVVRLKPGKSVKGLTAGGEKGAAS